MSEQREHKFKNSYSCKDYWQYYCKNCKKIPYKKYKEILDFIMEQYSFLISEKAMDIKFPYRLGQIRIRKYFKSPKFEGGELVNNLPINYKATKELWESDPEAKENKQVIYLLNQHSDGYMYQIRYTVSDIANRYDKLRFLKYKPARIMSRQFSKNIREHKIDALEQEKYEICKTS
jgi:hypothetical protein